MNYLKSKIKGIFGSTTYYNPNEKPINFDKNPIFKTIPKNEKQFKVEHIDGFVKKLEKPDNEALFNAGIQHTFSNLNNITKNIFDIFNIFRKGVKKCDLQEVLRKKAKEEEKGQERVVEDKTAQKDLCLKTLPYCYQIWGARITKPLLEGTPKDTEQKKDDDIRTPISIDPFDLSGMGLNMDFNYIEESKNDTESITPKHEEKQNPERKELIIQEGNSKAITLINANGKPTNIPVTELENGNFEIFIQNPNKKKENSDLLLVDGDDSKALVLGSGDEMDSKNKDNTTEVWQIGEEFFENFKNPEFDINRLFQDAWKRGCSGVKIEITPGALKQFKKLAQITGSEPVKGGSNGNKKLLEYKVEVDKKADLGIPLKTDKDRVEIKPELGKEIKLNSSKNDVPAKKIVERTVTTDKIPLEMRVIENKEKVKINPTIVELDEPEISEIENVQNIQEKTVVQENPFIKKIKEATKNWKAVSESSWQAFIKGIQRQITNNTLQENAKAGLLKRAKEMDAYFQSVKSSPAPVGRAKVEVGYGQLPSFNWGRKSETQILGDLLNNPAIVAALIKGDLTAEDLKKLVAFLLAFFKKQLEIEAANANLPANDQLAETVFKWIQTEQVAWTVLKGGRNKSIHDNMGAIVLELQSPNNKKSLLELLSNPPKLSLWNKVWYR